jgi:hypothetical protein
LQFDLCNLLEVFRLRHRLTALVLSEPRGLMVAGAGRYEWCEVLGAGAPAATLAEALEICVSGERLRLSAGGNDGTRRSLDAESAKEISDACERMLARRKTELSLLLEGDAAR